MNRDKPKLFRKVNTKAKGVHHLFGGDYTDRKRNKKETVQHVRGTMFGDKQRGLDYTPLFKFLLSKVGCKWDAVFSEAKSRIDREEPIFWMVALQENEKKDFVRIGESTYYSGLFVDEAGILQIVNPNLTAKEMTPFFHCCTHTFNGKLFGT